MDLMGANALENNLRVLNDLRLQLATARGRLESSRRPLACDDALALVGTADELARRLMEQWRACTENHVTRENR